MVRNVWRVVYFVGTFGLLAAGFFFEEPFAGRRMVLLGLMALYLVLGLLAQWSAKKTLMQTLTVVALMAVLLLIEMNAKYAMNYFFHTLYIFLMFFCIISVRYEPGIVLSLLVTLISFVKFIQLLAVAPTFANMALMVFFGSVQLLVMAVGIFLRVYQEESNKTKALYQELLEAHDQLKAYADEIRELSQMEARTNIARDLHDTLGHDLTGLIMQMEMAGGHFEEGEMKAGLDRLTASKTSARESLTKVRQIVETLKSNAEIREVKEDIGHMIRAFSHKTGVVVDYSHRGEGQLRPEKNIVLYRVVQECLTNAVRHGEAHRVRVILIYGTDGVDFQVEDDGKGCDSVIWGNGLKGMRERLGGIGGRMQVEGRPVFKVWGRIDY